MINMLAWFAGIVILATVIYRAALRGIPRQKVIHIARNRADQGPTDAPASPYDACGCIAPCPDHKSIKQDGQRDRAYWSDRYAEQIPEVDQEQD